MEFENSSNTKIKLMFEYNKVSFKSTKKIIRRIVFEYYNFFSYSLRIVKVKNGIYALKN